VIYLLDTSALVRPLRDRKLQEAWYDAIDAFQPGHAGSIPVARSTAEAQARRLP
jgi:hypothetical protein